MKKEKLFIRDSADDIAFEQCEPSDDDMEDFDRISPSDDDTEDFDRISSHLVECKCRSGSGSDGSLKRALQIQKRIADIKGSSAHADIVMGDAVYLRVSTIDQELLSELIPSKSERIQLMHYAYTYDRETVTYLVGNPNGDVLFGLVVTFEPDLLKSYDEVLQFLYKHGLNLFHGSDIDEVPLDLIEGILLSTPTLKSKYQLNDFVTSFLIWRELFPCCPESHKFPIPACNMLLPIEHSLWNNCKGGSDTVTRFAWNCLSVA